MDILISVTSKVVLVVDDKITKKDNTYVTTSRGTFYPADTLELQKVTTLPGDFNPGTYCYDAIGNGFYLNEEEDPSI